MGKESFYYRELREMLQQPGCPICHIGHKVARGQIDALLYDSVTDKDSREKLTASMGFCSAHSRELLSFPGERLGATIIEWAVLREAQRRLQRSRPAAAPSIRQRLKGQAALRSSLAATEPCPICVNQAEIETRSLSELLENLLGDLETPLRAVGGLCWPHLSQAMRAASDPLVHAALVSLHDAAWQELVDLMGEFIRKRDYRFSDETITEEETAALERSIAVLTGVYPSLS
jgi:hypothetical protein